MTLLEIILIAIVAMLLLAAALLAAAAATAAGLWLSERGRNRSLVGLPALGGYAAQTWAPTTEPEAQVDETIRDAEIAVLADGIKQLAAQEGTLLSDEEAAEEAERVLFRLDAGLDLTHNHGPE